jgi:hypothetical protein
MNWKRRELWDLVIHELNNQTDVGRTGLQKNAWLGQLRRLGTGKACNPRTFIFPLTSFEQSST